MHSGRMRTDRSSGYRGGGGVCLPVVAVSAQTPLWAGMPLWADIWADMLL